MVPARRWRATLTLPLLLAAPLARAQPPAEGASATLGEVVFLGDPFGTEAAAVAGVLQRRMSAVQLCYVRSLAQSPTLAGEMQLDVTFGRNGRTTAVVATGLGSVPAVAQCVTGVLRAITFPRLRPREAQSVRFLVPVNFRRGG